MKKLLLAALTLCFALSLTSFAADGDPAPKKKRELTDEQKAVQKEMLEKYDANKDGKLDKDERAKFSADDKAKWEKVFPPRKKKDAN